MAYQKTEVTLFRGMMLCYNVYQVYPVKLSEQDVGDLPWKLAELSHRLELIT